MAVIPFPAMSAAGRKAQESGGRLINCYAREVLGAPANPVLWARSAGLRRIVSAGTGQNCRGLVSIGSVLVHILDEKAHAVTRSGDGYVSTELGALSGAAPITIAQNNALPTPNTVCVTEIGAFNLFSDAAPSSFADGDLSGPNSVTSLDGYLVFTTAGGRIQASDLNSVSVASNSFEDVPEGSLLRGIVFNNELYAFGAWGFRVYQNAGTSPFPLEYARVKRDIGLAGTHAIAGDQEGWSDALIFAGSDNRVYRMEGYTPVPISTPDVSRSLESVADRSSLTAAVYVSEGYSFWTLTSPGNWTWEYNLSTGLWNEKQSYGRGDWRGRRSIRMFDRWIVGDVASSDLLETVAGLGAEGNDPLVYTLYSGVLSGFPNRINAVRSWFRLTAGIGVATGQVPIETNPRVAISWSRDGGVTFGNSLFRDLGSEGDNDTLVTIGNTGFSSSKGLQFRLSISDPVHAGFMGGEAQIEAAAP